MDPPGNLLPARTRCLLRLPSARVMGGMLHLPKGVAPSPLPPGLSRPGGTHNKKDCNPAGKERYCELVLGIRGVKSFTGLMNSPNQSTNQTFVQ